MQAKLADYLRERAKWRSSGFQGDDPGDNAAALDAAALEIEQLPPDDQRLAALGVLQKDQPRDVFMLLSEDGHRLVERYGLGGPGDVATVAELLDRLIECEAGESTDEYMRRLENE